MGEPLTHSLLPEFIRMATGKGFKSAVTTNGTLLDKVGDALIAAGVYKVNISVHSFEGSDGERFLDYINTCMDFADKASRAGVLVILRLWNNGYDGGRNEDILALLKNRFADGEWKYSSNGARIRHRLHLEYGERFSWPDIEAEDGGDNVFCYGLADHFSVLCDGTVVPCCLDRNGELSLGNAFTQSFDEILNSERAKNIRDGFKKRHAPEELCRKCGYARRFK
jgi:radical SAM protein with 4Fe4S-binding SPASM domain